MTLSRSTYARSFRLATCTDSMEICGREVPGVDVQQEGTLDSSGDGEAGSEPVRVRTGGASVGSEAGKLQRAALARVKSTIDLTASASHVMDLCHSILRVLAFNP